MYDITNLRDLVNSVSWSYYNITDEKENHLDDINLFNWTENDEKMFEGYTAD